ncbi:S8 family serine peptidase [Streptomyces hydrogenans]
MERNSMKPSSARPTPRTSVVLGAGLVSLILGLPAMPAQATETPEPLGSHTRQDTPKPGRNGTGDKLGNHDRSLLQDAEAKQHKTVTVLLATDRKETRELASQVRKLGGHIGKSHDSLGYVRATVPTDRVDQLTSLGSVTAVDLDATYQLPNPRPAVTGDKATGDRGTAKAPSADTPADNPYLPTGETGAVDFTDKHKRWDGRGVTIGILDSGVDVGHPALQRTSDGKPKITDWVTATDPVLGNDPTWSAMSTPVTAVNGEFKRAGITWKAPADGGYLFQSFSERDLYSIESDGDLNRDGDRNDSFGILYRDSDDTIWVDADLDRSFGAADRIEPYATSGEHHLFGTDDPDTAISEAMPFTVEHREDVDLSARGGPYVGKTADFVGIGLVAGAHGTHVAGIAAGHGLFGGEMDGAAPGAQIVSQRVCNLTGGCSTYAITEGMIDVVTKHKVDVVNMSVGGLSAMNDGSDVRELLFDRLIDDYGVQIFVSAGNEGPGMNTVGTPSASTRVVSVGASVSRETWWADYGTRVKAPQALFTFSSRGPREDGDLKPTLVAPGAAVSTVPSWLPGSAVHEAGYQLPPGYGMFNGTSMASPQATGAAALLLSAAADNGREITPAALRGALTSTADFIRQEPAYAQGAGLIDVDSAWQQLSSRLAQQPTQYDVAAPVCSVLSGSLAVPHTGNGLYNRCAPDAGGQRPGESRTYEIELTRTSGSLPLAKLSWLGNDGTFHAPDTILLGKGKPAMVKVTARPKSTGAHSAVLRVDDPATPGHDRMILVTIIAAESPERPRYTVSDRGEVDRGNAESVFVSVPTGAAALTAELSGLADGSRTRFLAIDPQGMPVDSTDSDCYPGSPDDSCGPHRRVYPQPMAGVWEFQVDASRTTPQHDNPYRLTAAVQEASFDPATGTLDKTALYTPVEHEFTVTNRLAPVTAHGAGGGLGALAQARATVTDGSTNGKAITVPRDATRLEIAMGNASDPKADVDLILISQAKGLVARSANAGSVESIVISNPAPGNYMLYLAGTKVPSGSTSVDVQDTLFSNSLGTVTVDNTKPVELASGESLNVRGRLTAEAQPPSGRSLVARYSLLGEDETLLGSADIAIGEVTQPKVEVFSSFGPAVVFDMDDNGRISGSQQRNGTTAPMRWDVEHGATALPMGEGRTASVIGQSPTSGLSVGQVTLPEGTRPALWDKDDKLTVLPLPQWEEYRFARAYAANDDGVVVGVATAYLPIPGTSTTKAVNDPFVWTERDGYRKLDHLTSDRTRSEPLAVKEDGTVVGHSTKNGTRMAVSWTPDGSVTELGRLSGMADSTAKDISDAGTIVGSSGDDAFVRKPDGELTRLRDFGFDAKALKVNEAGWIAGTAELGPDVETAVVWDPQGRIYDLGAVVNSRRWRVMEGIAVDNRGNVAFYAMDAEDDGRSKVLVARIWAN